MMQNSGRIFPQLKKLYDVDTEVVFGLLQMYRRQGQPIVDAVRSTYKTIDGSASIAVLFDDHDYLLLATNTGSLYTCASTGNDALIFASEKHILKQLISSGSVKYAFSTDAIRQLQSRHRGAYFP